MTHIIGGLIALALGMAGIASWWDNFGSFLRGGLPIALLIGGLVAISTGIQFRQSGKQSKDN